MTELAKVTADKLQGGTIWGCNEKQLYYLLMYLDNNRWAMFNNPMKSPGSSVVKTNDKDNDKVWASVVSGEEMAAWINSIGIRCYGMLNMHIEQAVKDGYEKGYMDDVNDTITNEQSLQYMV